MDGNKIDLNGNRQTTLGSSLPEQPKNAGRYFRSVSFFEAEMFLPSAPVWFSLYR